MPKDSSRNRTSGGEKQGGRDAMDRTIKRAVDSGMRPERAKELARGAAIRVNHKGGNR